MRRFWVLLVIAGLVAGLLANPATAQASFGIDPGKVFIDNLYPGAEADVPITIYNNNDYEASFVIKVRAPDYTEAGYESLPYLSWVTVTPDRITIRSGEKAEVTAIIIMPEDADYSGKKAEVWISFMEEDTPGMVKIELASRLLISTRVEEANVPTTTPTVTEGRGSVGITAEAGKVEGTVTPPTAKPASTSFPWAILGSVLGIVVVGVAVFFLVKKRRHA